MGYLQMNFDEQAEKCLGLAKAIARGEDNDQLDSIHLLKAAIVAFSEEALQYLSFKKSDWPEGLWQLITPVEGFQAMTNRMPVTKALGFVLHELSKQQQVITLKIILEAILKNPTIRIKSLLDSQKVKSRGPDRRQGESGARPCYHSRRDWLEDLHFEWKLRKQIIRALRYEPNIFDYEYQRKNPLDSGFETLIRLSCQHRNKADNSPRKFDPLDSIAAEVDLFQRKVCEGILVYHVYGFDTFDPVGIEVRDLAQMLEPETYPRNWPNVLQAVNQLETKGIIACEKMEELPTLNGQIQLTGAVLTQILSDLAQDSISAGELREMKRRVRLGADL